MHQWTFLNIVVVLLLGSEITGIGVWIRTHAFTLHSKNSVRQRFFEQCVRVLYYMGRMLDVIMLWPYAIRLRKFLYLKITFVCISFTLWVIHHTSMYLLVILICPVNCLFLFFGLFFNWDVRFLLAILKAFSILNIITLFYYLHYKYLFPYLLFINFLRYGFPYTDFKCLCSKYIHYLFPSF